MLSNLIEPNPHLIVLVVVAHTDRGAWGIELLSLLAALKLEHPTRVFLLRGNHESSTCTKFYGMKVSLMGHFK